MTVRQIHFIIRAALNLAVKWEWIASNPAEKATVPRYVRQDVSPLMPRWLRASSRRPGNATGTSACSCGWQS
jgi:hypothetical protein